MPNERDIDFPIEDEFVNVLGAGGQTIRMPKTVTESVGEIQEFVANDPNTGPITTAARYADNTVGANFAQWATTDTDPFPIGTAPYNGYIDRIAIVFESDLVLVPSDPGPLDGFDFTVFGIVDGDEVLYGTGTFTGDDDYLDSTVVARRPYSFVLTDAAAGLAKGTMLYFRVERAADADADPAACPQGQILIDWVDPTISSLWTSDMPYAEVEPLLPGPSYTDPGGGGGGGGGAIVTMTSMSPTSGGPGTAVIVNGTNFNGVLGQFYRVNSVQVTGSGGTYVPCNFTILSDTQLRVIIPNGAANGDFSGASTRIYTHSQGNNSSVDYVGISEVGFHVTASTPGTPPPGTAPTLTIAANTPTFNGSDTLAAVAKATSSEKWSSLKWELSLGLVEKGFSAGVGIIPLTSEYAKEGVGLSRTLNVSSPLVKFKAKKAPQKTFRAVVTAEAKYPSGKKIQKTTRSSSIGEFAQRELVLDHPEFEVFMSRPWPVSKMADDLNLPNLLLCMVEVNVKHGTLIRGLMNWYINNMTFDTAIELVPLVGGTNGVRAIATIQTVLNVSSISVWKSRILDPNSTITIEDSNKIEHTYPLSDGNAGNGFMSSNLPGIAWKRVGDISVPPKMLILNS